MCLIDFLLCEMTSGCCNLIYNIISVQYHSVQKELPAFLHLLQFICIDKPAVKILAVYLFNVKFPIYVNCGWIHQRQQVTLGFITAFSIERVCKCGKNFSCLIMHWCWKPPVVVIEIGWCRHVHFLSIMHYMLLFRRPAKVADWIGT